MSVLKKLTSLLFEESVDEVMVEDRMEPIEIKEKPKPVEKKEMEQKRKAVVSPKPMFQQEKVEETPKEEEKKFVSIDLEERPKPKPVAKQAETSRTSTGNVTHRKEEKKEFEFSPVISPIFGSKEDKGKPKPIKKSTTSMITKRRKKNPLGTVISPYYGLGELEEFEAEAQEKIEEKEKNRKEGLSENVIASVDVQEEVNSVPLEDMLGDVDMNEDNKDDLMQISLFGESTPVKDTEESLNV